MRVGGLSWASAMGVLLLACASTHPSGTESFEVRSQALESLGYAALGAQTIDAEPRLLIRSANLSLDVDDLEAAAASVVARVEGLRGVVRQSRGDDEQRTLVVAVPSHALEGFLDALETLGDVTRRVLQAEDVTENHADLVAELKNTHAFRDRLRLLLERAETVEEVLQVERELTRVQTQLDRLAARKKRLDTDVALATVHVHLEQTERAVPGPLAIVAHGVYWLVEKLWTIPLPR